MASGELISPLVAMNQKLLCFDISTKTGYSLIEVTDGAVKLKAHGLVKLSKPICDHGPYPWNYLAAARDMADRLMFLVHNHRPDVVVIEEINLGKNRYTQKGLDFLHQALLVQLQVWVPRPQIVYLSSSEWRHALGFSMSKEDRKNNKLLKAAKATAAVTGGKVDKASLGVKGKITQKHLAIRYINDRFNLAFKQKDNDVAEAICLGCAYLTGNAKACDGR